MTLEEEGSMRDLTIRLAAVLIAVLSGHCSADNSGPSGSSDIGVADIADVASADTLVQRDSDSPQIDAAAGCEPQDCAEHGLCVGDAAGEPSCLCEEGYYPSSFDLRCLPDPPPPQPCDGLTCSGHGSCVDSGGVASCVCDTDYTANGTRCLSVAPPVSYDIMPMPAEFLSHPEVIALLKTWESEAPDIAQYGEYGAVHEGASFFAEVGAPYAYLRVGTPGQPKLVLYAGIHANETRGFAGTMWIMGHMLAEYGLNDDVTWLVNNRDVWWIPVLIPEMFPRRRSFTGDPDVGFGDVIEAVSTMTDFPDPAEPERISIPPIAAFRELFERERFVASISAHDTSLSGGYYWINPIMFDANGLDEATIITLVEEMRPLAFAEVIPDTYKALSDTGGNDIHWAYWHGALPLLIEFGNGTAAEPRIDPEDIEGHGQQHFPEYMHFIRRAPELQPQLTTATQPWDISW